MVQQVKLKLVELESHTMPVCVLAAPHPTRLPDNGLGKEAGHHGHLGSALTDGRSLSPSF